MNYYEVVQQLQQLNTKVDSILTWLNGFSSTFSVFTGKLLELLTPFLIGLFLVVCVHLILKLFFPRYSDV